MTRTIAAQQPNIVYWNALRKKYGFAHLLRLALQLTPSLGTAHLEHLPIGFLDVCLRVDETIEPWQKFGVAFSRKSTIGENKHLLLPVI